MKKINKGGKFFLTMAVAFMLSLSVVGVTRALLTDKEESYQNTIKAATINLQVGDSDPSVMALDFSEVVPDQIYKSTTNVISNGGLAGNFWMALNITNSQEAENPEGETNTTGKGELEDCAELRIVFDEGTPEELILLEHTIASMAIMDLDPGSGSTLDQRLQAGTEMTVQLRTNFCGNEAMGDSFDLNFDFHLDQV